MRSRPGDNESDSQYRYRQVCQALSTCCYVTVLRALATDDVTLANERLSANDVLALALALEVTSRLKVYEYNYCCCYCFVGIENLYSP